MPAVESVFPLSLSKYASSSFVISSNINVLLVEKSAPICENPKRFSDVSIDFFTDIIYTCFFRRMLDIIFWEGFFYLKKACLLFWIDTFILLNVEKNCSNLSKCHFLIFQHWNEICWVLTLLALLVRTCVGYLLFLFSVLRVFISHLLEVKNIFCFATHLFFSFKYPLLIFWHTLTKNHQSAVIMQYHLDMSKVPRPDQEETFDEEKM